MWKAALAGAVALATIGSLSISSNGIGISSAMAQDVVVSESQIVRLKGALKLTPAQMRHWHAVETQLRLLARQYRVASMNPGIFERTRSRVSEITVSTVTMQRLKVAAQPLIESLTEDQKYEGILVLRSMGFSSL